MVVSVTRNSLKMMCVPIIREEHPRYRLSIGPQRYIWFDEIGFFGVQGSSDFLKIWPEMNESNNESRGIESERKE